MGTAPSWDQCKFDTEVWGVNGAYTVKDRVKNFRMDKIFITDRMFSPEGTMHFDIHVMNRMGKDFNCEFITLNPISIGKLKLKSTPYPWDEIVEKFKSKYFSSTICHMLAYALWKNYEKISLYGIDMASRREYQQQKGGVEYWLGRAQERGCEITISQGSVLLVPPTTTPYGQDRKFDMSRIDPYGLLKGSSLYECSTKSPTLPRPVRNSLQ